MAKPFYDHSQNGHQNRGNGGSAANSPSAAEAGRATPNNVTNNNNINQTTPPPSSVTTSTTNSPLQSPIVNNEHLVQAFCEAFYRCHIGGSPMFPLSPQSPSCSSSTNGVYGDVFFPRTPRTPWSPDSGYDLGVQRLPRSPRNFPCRSRRVRLTSTGDDYEDDCSSDIDDEWDEHCNFMAARERLQEFQGRLPPRKKKKDLINKSKPKTKEPQTFAWPTVVTAVVLAVGCGILVAR